MGIRGVEGRLAAAGGHATEAKYGHRLQERFAMPGGAGLRDRIDDMENEDYQILIRRPGAELRERLIAVCIEEFYRDGEPAD